MQAKPTQWTSRTTVVAVAMMLSSLTGCVHVGHYLHWHTPLKDVHEQHHLAYYHCSHCGRIVPRHAHHVCSPLLQPMPDYGFNSTCWRAWPHDWVPCPPPERVAPVDPAAEPVDALPPMQPSPSDLQPMIPQPMPGIVPPPVIQTPADPAPTPPAPAAPAPTQPQASVTPSAPPPLEPQLPTPAPVQLPVEIESQETPPPAVAFPSQPTAPSVVQQRVNEQAEYPASPVTQPVPPAATPRTPDPQFATPTPAPRIAPPAASPALPFSEGEAREPVAESPQTREPVTPPESPATSQVEPTLGEPTQVWPELPPEFAPTVVSPRRMSRDPLPSLPLAPSISAPIVKRPLAPRPAPESRRPEPRVATKPPQQETVVTPAKPETTVIRPAEPPAMPPQSVLGPDLEVPAPSRRPIAEKSQEPKALPSSPTPLTEIHPPAVTLKPMVEVRREPVMAQQPPAHSQPTEQRPVTIIPTPTESTSNPSLQWLTLPSVSNANPSAAPQPGRTPVPSPTRSPAHVAPRGESSDRPQLYGPPPAAVLDQQIKVSTPSPREAIVVKPVEPPTTAPPAAAETTLQSVIIRPVTPPGTSAGPSTAQRPAISMKVSPAPARESARSSDTGFYRGRAALKGSAPTEARAPTSPAQPPRAESQAGEPSKVAMRFLDTKPTTVPTPSRTTTIIRSTPSNNPAQPAPAEAATSGEPVRWLDAKAAAREKATPTDDSPDGKANTIRIRAVEYAPAPAKAYVTKASAQD